MELYIVEGQPLMGASKFDTNAPGSQDITYKDEDYNGTFGSRYYDDWD